MGITRNARFIARPVIIVAAALPILIGLVVTGADGPTADSFAVDLDTTGNTATALGTIDECREVSAGDIFTIDVTAANVPSGPNAMIAFTYYLAYETGVMGFTARNNSGLLSTAVGYNELDWSDPSPDTDGMFVGSVIDAGGQGVSGSGYLQRLTIAVDTGAVPGGYALTLMRYGTSYVDTLNTARTPYVLVGARLAVDVSCASLGAPTATPLPNKVDDVDCNGIISAIDALKVLRYTIHLPASQTEPCDDIGTGSLALQGDVDCDSDVDVVDSLKLLRFVAGDSVIQNEPCPDIGA